MPAENAHLAGMKVEIGRIKLVALGKVRHAHAKMSKLVYGRRPLLEALELVWLAVLLVRLSLQDATYQRLSWPFERF